MPKTIRDGLHRAAQEKIQPQTWAELPRVCASVGFPPVVRLDDDVKSGFVRRCVDAVPEERLTEVAVAFLRQYPFDGLHQSVFELEELVHATEPPMGLSKKVRREIAQLLEPDELFVDGRAFIALLGSLFRIDTSGGWGAGLREEIDRHVLDHCGDWTVEHLFDRLGAYNVSERRFAMLLEGLVSADVRPNEGSIRTLAERLNRVLVAAGVELRETNSSDGYPTFRLVGRGKGAGKAKNIIFASIEKPDIRFLDAMNNDIEIVGGRDSVLAFDRPIPSHGLLWRDLQSWYAESYGVAEPMAAKTQLYERLRGCLPAESPPQKALFKAYYTRLGTQTPQFPALLPEVWLHWDWKAVQARGADALLRFRMDFLLLLPGDVRIVVEVDGKHHYANEAGRADVIRYAQMVAADRDLRLAGYEVYRFGAAELMGPQAEEVGQDFFARLFKRHGVTPHP